MSDVGIPRRKLRETLICHDLCVYGFLAALQAEAQHERSQFIICQPGRMPNAVHRGTALPYGMTERRRADRTRLFRRCMRGENGASCRRHLYFSLRPGTGKQKRLFKPRIARKKFTQR